MSVVHLDTHVAIWLYTRLESRAAPARKHLQDKTPRISPMALLEIDYLFEIGRVRGGSGEVVAGLRERIGLEVATEAFADVASAARRLTWTRDPFDRMIAAHALVAGVPLVTADANIRAHCPIAVWG